MNERVKNKYMNSITYAWTNNPQSISHSKYELDDGGGERSFLEVYFEDYLKATGYIYLNLYKNGQLSKRYATARSIEVVCYAYFYTQGFQFARKDFRRENLAIAGKFLNECKQAYGLKNNAAVYNLIAENNAAMYKRIRPHADRGVHYVPQQGLKQWLDLVDRHYKQTLDK